MNKKIVSVTILVVTLLSASCLAGAGKRGAAFLSIPVGARASALGEAYSGASGDILSLYWNPAGLADIKGYELSFSHARWIEDITYSNFTAGLPAGGGYLAVGVNGLFMGDIDKYNRHGDDVGDTYSPSDIAVSAAYSARIKDFSAGAAVKYIASEIDSHRADAVAIDLGVMRSLGSLNAGISVQNLGTEMKFRNKSDPLPVITRLGLSYPFYLAGLDFLAASEISHSESVPFRVNGGLESVMSVNEVRLSLRLGLKSYADGLDALSHFTSGLGISYRTVALDYAFASMEDLGLIHRVSLGYAIN